MHRQTNEQTNRRTNEHNSSPNVGVGYKLHWNGSNADARRMVESQENEADRSFFQRRIRSCVRINGHHFIRLISFERLVKSERSHLFVGTHCSFHKTTISAGGSTIWICFCEDETATAAAAATTTHWSWPLMREISQLILRRDMTTVQAEVNPHKAPFAQQIVGGPSPELEALWLLPECAYYRHS